MLEYYECSYGTHQDFSHVQQLSDRNYFESILMNDFSSEFWNSKVISDLRTYHPRNLGIAGKLRPQRFRNSSYVPIF